MTNDPSVAEGHFTLMRACSSMDDFVVERLRATVEMSLGWADETLNILLRLDDDLQVFDAHMVRQIQSLSPGGAPLDGVKPDQPPNLEELVRQTEQSVQGLRNGIRDIMMSMQYQDVIGQSVERAASAVEKRAAAVGRVVEMSGVSESHTDEVAEIHSAYRKDDDLHRPPVLNEDDKEEYHAAA